MRQQRHFRGVPSDRISQTVRDWWESSGREGIFAGCKQSLLGENHVLAIHIFVTQEEFAARILRDGRVPTTSLPVLSSVASHLASRFSLLFSSTRHTFVVTHSLRDLGCTAAAAPLRVRAGHLRGPEARQ